MNERAAATSAAAQRVREVHKCLACESTSISRVLSLGRVPLADMLNESPDRRDGTVAIPLELFFCCDCTLAQIGHVVPPAMLYGGGYPYYSSLVPGLIQQYRQFAADVTREMALTRESLVIEIGSNDGYLLSMFAHNGIPVMGIDPAEGPAAVARRAGVETIVSFFDESLARRLHEDGRLADVVIANNMLNLVADVAGFARGVRFLVKERGVVMVQSPYLVDMIEACAFDMIFHANVGYFSATAADRVFRQVGLYVNKVERLPDVMGGSLRFHLELRERPDRSAAEILEEEERKGIGRRGYYDTFATRVRETREALLTLVTRLRSEGKRIVAYGAGGGMATTLLSYVGLDHATIDYAVDANPHKHGKYLPGLGIQIHPPSRLLEDRPECVLLLAWNYQEQILRDHAAYRQLGGRFIIPLPEPRVV